MSIIDNMPEPMSRAARQAAFETLRFLGYTYTEGAEQWKPPVAVAQAPAAEPPPCAEAIALEQAEQFLHAEGYRWSDEQETWAKTDASPPVGPDVARDAARYRWLRQCTAGEWEKLNGLRIDHGMKQLDTAIDAALGQTGENQP